MMDPDRREQPAQDGRWVRVIITVDPGANPSAPEVASDVLWSAGAAGVEEQASALGVSLIGGFEDADAADRAVGRARSLGLEAVAETIADDGLDAWRAWAVAEQAGRFWITPTWVEAPEIGPEEEILWIDPGPTFGSGSHPTTRLVLELLADLVVPGAAMLDAGCGSGVLAVGAARCGANPVVATDIDPASPEITRANAERNGVGAIVHATTDKISEVADRGARFNVVAANLLAPVIAEVGADLATCLAPNGRLVISGLLADRWEATAALLAPLVVERVAEEQGWVAVVLR